MDSLQEIWNAVDGEGQELNLLKEEDLTKNESKDIYERLKIKFKKYYLFSLIFSVVFLVIAHLLSFYIKWISILLIALMIFYTVFAIYINKRFNSISTENILDSLKSKRLLLQSCVKIDFMITIFIVPIGFLMGFYAGVKRVPGSNFYDLWERLPWILPSILVVSILLIFPIRNLYKFLLNKLYGKELRELDSLINGFENTQE